MKQTVKIADKEYDVLPLNLKTLIEISPLFDSMTKITEKNLPTEQDFKNIVTIVHAALKRGNPDVTIEELAENLDTENMLNVLQVIMLASGAVPSGEAKAVNQ